MKNKYVWVLCLTFLMLNTITICICFGQVETVNKYEPIDLKQDKFFVRYFDQFKSLVKNSDSKGLAKLFDNNYPKLLFLQKVKGTGPSDYKEILIKNRMEFIKYFSKIFDKRMRDLIASTQIENLELMEGGIKLGIGEVWWLYNLRKKEIKLSYISN